jgi:non-ribosomal peptide synthetase component F
MTVHFSELLTSITAAPRQKIRALPMLTSSEKRQLLEQFSHNELGYTQQVSIVDLFEEQAAKTPTKIALVFDDKELTFQE